MMFVSFRNVRKPLTVLLVASLILAVGLVVFSHVRPRMWALRSYYSDGLTYELLARVGKGEPGAPVSTGSGRWARSIPVLVYHGITATGDGFEVGYEDFKTQLFELKKAGFQTITLADYAAVARGEDIALPAKPFLLTFDDGRRDSYYPVDPLLQYLDYHAAMFFIGDTLNINKSDYYLRPTELAVLRNSTRWDLGSHGYHSHREVTIDAAGNKANWLSHQTWQNGQRESQADYHARVSAEFAAANQSLTHDLKTTASAFAYPFGDFGQNQAGAASAAGSVDAIARAHFPLTFSQRSSANRLAMPEPREQTGPVTRIEVTSSWSAQDVLNAVENYAPKQLPLSSGADLTGDGWAVATGELDEPVGAPSVLRAAAGKSIASVVLGGAQDWTQVSISAEFGSVQASALALYGRYRDDENNLACVFSDGYIGVDQRINGTRHSTKKVAAKGLSLAGSPQLSMQIQGSDVRCGYGDQSVTWPGVATGSPSGSVGIGLWRAAGGGSTDISAITVAPASRATDQ